MKNIAIFASGTGSNAVQIMDHFKDHVNINIILVISNNANAKVLDSAKERNIKTRIITKQILVENENIISLLKENNIDLIVLAGFLLLIPLYMTKTFNNRIINIHPALLPKYGGKGMYGHFVHEAVYKNKEKESGITIHYVNENYDDGAIIFQESVDLNENDSPKTIAQKVLNLEHKYYKKIIEKIIT